MNMAPEWVDVFPIQNQDITVLPAMLVDPKG